MRRFILLLCAGLACPSIVCAQIEVNDRSSVLYVIGRVAKATETSCLVDIGNVHTVRSQKRLALFRPVDNFFVPIGHVTVDYTITTASHCIHDGQAQPNDVVMMVREISELHPGPRHRNRILKRRIVRSYLQTASSTFNNVPTANALSHYEKQFPEWESSRAAVAGELLSERLLTRDDERLDRLQAQLNLMRRLYEEDARMVSSAGEPWENAIALLAGRTATAAHALRVEEQLANDNQAATIRLSADELRRRVFDMVFHLEPEQRNTVALVIASLLPDSSIDNSIQLRTAIAQTQFPDLEDDDQLLEDMGRLLLTLRDLNQSQ